MSKDTEAEAREFAPAKHRKAAMVETFTHRYGRLDNGSEGSRPKYETFVRHSDYAALKAENERLTRIIEVEGPVTHWKSRAEAAERALAERAGGVKEAQIEAEARKRCYAICSTGGFLDFEAGCCTVCTSEAECQGWRALTYEVRIALEAGGTARRGDAGSGL